MSGLHSIDEVLDVFQLVHQPHGGCAIESTARAVISVRVTPSGVMPTIIRLVEVLEWYRWDRSWTGY